MSDPREKDNREAAGEGFVRERIVNRSSKKRWAVRMILAGICGVLFGLAAGVTIAAVLPKASTWFAEETTAPYVQIPRDETTGADESREQPTEAPSNLTQEDPSGGETDAPTEAPEPTEESVLDEESIRALVSEMIANGLDAYKPGTSEAESIYRAMAVLGAKYNRALVTVVMKNTGQDIFQNGVETSRECVGVIWKETEEGRLYIMSSGTIPSDRTEIQVIFSDGSRRDAVFCQADSLTKLVVLRVDDFSHEELEEAGISVLPLGNSYGVRQGDPLLVIGNTIGYSGAVVPSVVTYTGGAINAADSTYHELYLDGASVAGANGFAISLSGSIVGIITPDTAGNVTGMLGISDLKGVLELLANGMNVPSLGLIGQTITNELQEEFGLPAGVYVTDVTADSPAYVVGIKAGDVVTAIGGLDVLSVRRMRGVVEELDPTVPVTVTVMRPGSDGYQELQYTLTPTLR